MKVVERKLSVCFDLQELRFLLGMAEAAHNWMANEQRRLVDLSTEPGTLKDDGDRMRKKAGECGELKVAYEKFQTKLTDMVLGSSDGTDS